MNENGIIKKIKATIYKYGGFKFLQGRIGGYKYGCEIVQGVEEAIKK